MANAAEFTVAGQGAGVDSEIEAQRSQWVVVRNSRFLVGLVFIGSLAGVFMAICFALIALDALLPFSSFSFARLFNAVSWMFAALFSFTSCPWLWSMGRKIAHNEARLDSRGVDFQFGTQKAPQELFIAWDKVAGLQYCRSGNNRIYTVTGTDGSEATFSSYSFFRPRKLAKMIAARAGLSIKKC